MYYLLIPGLDPAGPGYGDDKMPAFRRLDKSDAKYVDIIHSSSPLLGENKEYTLQIFAVKLQLKCS